MIKYHDIKVIDNYHRIYIFGSQLNFVLQRTLCTRGSSQLESEIKVILRIYGDVKFRQPPSWIFQRPKIFGYKWNE